MKMQDLSLWVSVDYIFQNQLSKCKRSNQAKCKHEIHPLVIFHYSFIQTSFFILSVVLAWHMIHEQIKKHGKQSEFRCTKHVLLQWIRHFLCKVLVHAAFPFCCQANIFQYFSLGTHTSARSTHRLICKASAWGILP